MPGQGSGALEIRDLHGEILSGINLTIEAGECTCLQGPSGAGKTLLLRAIADLDPHRGEVVLDGLPASICSAVEWRKRTALVPSESAWWAPRVGDHFIESALELVTQLGFPEQVMGWSVNRLSSGERQRLALARALAGQPRALLLDEPTANLDMENTLRVETLVETFRRQHRAPVLWVSHDSRQAQRVCTRVCRIHHGRLEPPCN